MDKESILKQVNTALINWRYNTAYYMYCGVEGTNYGDDIIVRVYDYARLQCVDATQFFNIKTLLSRLKHPIDENWVDVLFYRAVLGKDFKSMRFHHAYGANIHAWNDVAVRLAFEISDYELAETLIDMGADVCANNGQTRKAVIKNQDMRMASLLIEALMKKEKVRHFLHNASVKEHSI